MKKGKLSIYMVLCVFCSTFASNAHSFIIPLPLIPCMPTLDFIKDIQSSAAVKEVVGIVNNIKKVKATLNAISDVKGKGLTYAMGTCFINCDKVGQVDKRPVKVAKEIQTTNIADIYDPESVKKAVYKTFLVLPSDGREAEDCYRNQGRKFFKDTSVELYSTAKELEKDIEILDKRIASLEKALEEGGETENGSLDAPDNSNTSWENAYQAYDILDQLLRLTQELKAMNMQYESALAVQDKVAPIRGHEAEKLKKERDAEKISSNLIFNEGKAYANGSIIASAQVSDLAKKDYDEYNFLNLAPAPKPNVSSPFDGQEKNLEALKEIKVVGDEVYSALNIHSLISSLDEYKNIFVSYDNFVKLHENSLTLLKTSDQCTINFLGKYYNSPEKVWSGGNLGALANQHELRKGVSKWLIDTFDVAKAEMISPLAPEDLKVAIVDTTVDNKKLQSFDKLKSSKSKDADKINPIKERRSSAIGRANYILPWNVGAEVSLDLGKDQQGQSKWGSLKKNYDLWYDQKNYYDQYIDNKYDNIVKYLEKIDLRPSQIDIARKLNSDNKIKVVNTHENAVRQNHMTWLNDLNGFENTFTQNEKANPEAEVLPKESTWVYPVKYKMGGIGLNHIKLNEREVVLKQQKTVLVKKKENLIRLVLTAQITTELAKIQKQIKAIDDELKDIADDRSWLTGFNSDLLGIVKIEEFTVATNAALSSAQEDELKAYADVENEFKQVFKTYSDTIDKAISDRDKEINTYNAKLEVISKKIEDAENKADIYNKTVNKAEEKDVEVREEFTKTGNTTINKESLKKKSTEQTSLVVNLGKEAKVIIAKIDERMKFYDGKIANAEREFSIKSRELYERTPQFDNMSPLSYLYSSKVVPQIGSGNAKYVPALTNYLKVGEQVSEEFRPYAVEQAEKARKDIFKLKDSLYLQSSNSTVNKRHKEFIEELKDISLDELLKFSTVLKNSYSGSAVLLETVKALYNKYVIETICNEDACYNNDEEYFVGLIDKPRDFRAPKEPIKEYLPPLREVFYFDDVNYSSLYSDASRIKIIDSEPKKVGNITIGTYKYHYVHYISKYGIATYGGRVPEVWKLALSSRAFVEKDIDLKKFFSDEDNNNLKTNFLRGGRYPCLLNDLTIDVDKNANFIINKTKSPNMPTCQEITTNSRLGYYTVVDKGTEDKSSVGFGESASREYASELGQLFYFSDDYVLYRDITEKVFDRIAQVKKYQEQEKNYDSNIRDSIYDNAVFKKNQFGDFLGYVELEASYRQAREKMKVSLDDVKKTLFEELRKVGYAPKEDLNLAKDSDYNDVKNALKNKKTKILHDVDPKIKALKDNENELVKQKFENFQLVHKALEMDSNELIAVPSTSPNLSELSEAIKTEAANRKAKEVYNKEVNSAIEKELKKMSNPYCASY